MHNETVQLKSLRSAHVLPSTGMAAHAVDEDVEIEVEKIDEIEMASDGIEKGATYMVKGLPFRLPPPPPVPCNAYLQVSLLSIHSRIYNPYSHLHFFFFLKDFAFSLQNIVKAVFLYTKCNILFWEKICTCSNIKC